MGRFVNVALMPFLIIGLIACSSSDGGSKKRNKNINDGDGAVADVTDADEKYQLLERYSLRTASLQIVRRDGDMMTLSFDKIDDGDVLYTLNGEVREQESKIEALTNSRIDYVADVRNIAFPARTLTPSVFYVVTKETSDAVRGDIYVFVYTDNEQPMNVAGPIRVRTSLGLDVFNEVVRAYEDAGRNYLEFLQDLLAYYDQNPGANYRTVKNDLIASIEVNDAFVPDGTGEDGCTKDCDDVVVDEEDRDGRRIVVDNEVGVPEYRVRPLPRHEVAIVEDRHSPVVDAQPLPNGVTDEYLQHLADTAWRVDHHPNHLCLDKRVTAYSAWGGKRVDLYPHRDDDGNQNTQNGWCTPSDRERIIGKAQDGTLNRRREPLRPCAPDAELQRYGFDGGFRFCKIKRVNVSPRPAPVEPRPPATRPGAPGRGNGVLSVHLKCGRNYGATMTVHGQNVNVRNASLCFNRPSNSIAASNMVRLPGRSIPGVDLIAVGYNFDFTKASNASQFVTVGRVHGETTGGNDVIFHYPTVFDLNAHRAQLNQLIRVVDRNGSEISRINMGCTIERHTHYCGEGGDH